MERLRWCGKGRAVVGCGWQPFPPALTGGEVISSSCGEVFAANQHFQRAFPAHHRHWFVGCAGPSWGWKPKSPRLRGSGLQTESRHCPGRKRRSCGTKRQYCASNTKRHTCIAGESRHTNTQATTPTGGYGAERCCVVQCEGDNDHGMHNTHLCTRTIRVERMKKPHKTM